jgi:hypothetical protein
MIAVEWTALSLGIAIGILMSLIFFAGLAFGMQRALRREGSVAVLFLSAVLRIAMFLGVGWGVVTQAGPWAFVGYGMAFFICRRIATTVARLPVPSGGEQ